MCSIFSFHRRGNGQTNRYDCAAAFGIPSASVHTVGAFRSAYEQFLGTPGISLIEVALPLRGVRDRYAPYQR